MFENLDDPRKQALLALAAGLFSPVRGKGFSGFGEALGQGVNAGLLGFNQAQRTQEAVKRGEMERQLEQARLAQMKQAQEEDARRREALGSMPDFSQPVLPSMAPTNENAAKLAQAPKPLPYEVMLKRAEYLSQKGLPDLADKYYQNAEKLRPEVKEVRQVVRNGTPADLVIYKDGTHQVLPYGSAVKQELADFGGSKAAWNPITGQVGAQYGKSVSPDAALSARTQIRGQDMTDARARDANAVSAGNKMQDISHSLRKEFNAIPEVQAYRSILPIVESARNAPDTPAGDFALIYGVGKALDPNSVVREGEMNMVIKSGSPAQRVEGYLRHLNGKGRLTPEMRKQLTAVLDQRAGEYASQYEAQKAAYTGIAEKSGIGPDQIFADLPAGQIKATTKPVKMGGKNVQARLAPDGKYYVQIGKKPDGSPRYAEVTE